MRFAYGAADAAIYRYAAVIKSYASPYDPRRAVRPSPNTSHAMPARGEKFRHCGLSPDFPFGNPGSPGKISPAGALMKTVLLIPLRKLSRLKFDTAPLRMFWPKNGSHRMPKFTVTPPRIRHESCPYRAM